MSLASTLVDPCPYRRFARLAPTYQPGSRIHINDLPVELLREVFLFHMSSYQCRSKSFESYHIRDPYAWIQITFVCRLWRKVALASPHLWSCIVASGTRSKFIETMLERSKGVLLTVAPAGWEPCERIMKEIFKQFYRCRALETYLDYDELARLDGTVLHAPLMEELYLSCLPPLNVLRYEVKDIQVPIHLPYSLGDGDRLLYGPGKFFCPSLRKLKLRDIDDPRLTALYTLDVLASLPQLEEVDIACRMSPVTSLTHPARRRERVSLSKLKALSLSGRHDGCTWVLLHLDFQPSTRLSCGAEGMVNVRTQEQDIPSTLFSVLSEKVKMSCRSTGIPDSKEPKYIRINHMYRGPTSLEMWRRSDDEGSRPDLAFHAEDPDAFLLEEMINGNFVLSHVEKLRIESHHGNPRFISAGPAFARVFRTATALRSLSLDKWFVGDVITLLLRCGVHGVEHEEGSSHPECYFVFPNLESLSVRYLDWSVRGEEKRLRDYDAYSGPEAVRQDRPLYNMLRRRQLENAPLKQLEIATRSNVKHDPKDVQLSLDLINGHGTKAHRVLDSVRCQLS